MREDIDQLVADRPAVHGERRALSGQPVDEHPQPPAPHAVLWPVAYVAVRTMRVWAAMTDLARKPEYIRAD